jgi:hypothetical protein
MSEALRLFFFFAKKVCACHITAKYTLVKKRLEFVTIATNNSVPLDVIECMHQGLHQL